MAFRLNYDTSQIRHLDLDVWPRVESVTSQTGRYSIVVTLEDEGDMESLQLPDRVTVYLDRRRAVALVMQLQAALAELGQREAQEAAP